MSRVKDEVALGVLRCFMSVLRNTIGTLFVVHTVLAALGCTWVVREVAGRLSR
jgi:hypothetical protein